MKYESTLNTNPISTKKESITYPMKKRALVLTEWRGVDRTVSRTTFFFTYIPNEMDKKLGFLNISLPA